MGTIERHRLLASAVTALLCVWGCAEDAAEVVVYTSVDQVFSQPVLERFESEKRDPGAGGL